MRSSDSLGSSRPEGVQDCNAETVDVAVIAGHPCQPIDRGRGRQEAVDDRRRPERTPPPPSMCHHIVDAKNAVAECAFDPCEPLFERRSLPAVVRACEFDSLADLS